LAAVLYQAATFIVFNAVRELRDVLQPNRRTFPVCHDHGLEGFGIIELAVAWIVKDCFFTLQPAFGRFTFQRPRADETSSRPILRVATARGSKLHPHRVFLGTVYLHLGNAV